MVTNLSARVCLIVLLAFAVLPSFGANLPPGFQKTPLATGNALPGVASISWGPDNKLWIAQVNAGMRIWIYEGPGPVSPPPITNVLTLPGNPSGAGERGIHTIHVDPNYSQNSYVWIFYSMLEEDPVFNRLSRWSFDGVQLGNELPVWESGPLDTQIHNGGCLAFGQDGTIFLGVGDDGDFTVGQDPFSHHGKILHMNPDGSPAADNPFLDGTAGDPLVWALGVRNPFRCNMQPGLDNLWIADVGAGTWEEISLGIAGANFGWGAGIEGPEPAAVPGMTYPFYAYNHNGSGAAIIGGDHAPSNFAPELEGDYFFGDFVDGEIYRMDLDEHGDHHHGVDVWATDMGALTDFEFGPDGDLYYSPRGVGDTGVGRISWVGGSNQQPTAVATVTPDSGPAPLMVTLDGTDSFDPDEDPLNYLWDLGDTNSSTNATTVYSYPQGAYTALLTVDDGEGLSDSTQPLLIVSGNEKPTPTITAPSPTLTYNAGDTIAFSGTGTDPEEGAIPCSQFGWKVDFHHNDHTHPHYGPAAGSCADSFSTPTAGETSANVWYRIYLSVSDTGAPIGPAGTLTGETFVEVYPNTSLMTFETAPHPDLELRLDTAPFTAPMTIEGVVNFNRTIGASDGQLHDDGHTYTWVSWSDGGDKTHPIVTPAVDTTYTANFVCDVIVPVPNLRLDHDGGSETLTLAWDPIVDSCHTSGSPLYQVYAASTPVPSTLPGSFPDDPTFTLLGGTDLPGFSYVADPDDKFFLVVGMGTDGEPGDSGHYDD